MSEDKPKRKMRNFLLDKHFQLKYTLAVVLVSSAISSGLGYFLYQSHRETSKVAMLGIDDFDQEVADSMRAELQLEDHKVFFKLVAFLGGLVLTLTLLGIIATHKIAGPAFVMRRTLSLIADGRLPSVRELRKGDELQEVGKELKRMAESLRSREEQDLESLQQLRSFIEKPDKSTDALARLGDLIQQKKDRLGT